MPASDDPACPPVAEIERLLTDGDPEGRLARHVAGCPRCADEVEDIRANLALLAELTRTHVTPVDAVPGTDPGPVALPGYELLDEIQRGGQGVVYRARQLATHRIVAIKVLLAGAFATSRQRRRFEREVELVAALDHPNVVGVFASGDTPEGGHYLVMRYVEGVPLDAWVRERRRGARPTLDARAVAALFAEICAGVVHAHQHGVLHRDLKPANILIDDDGRPHILDFGLARPIPGLLDTAEAAITREGVFAGTIAYASPEQAAGHPGQVDVRSDVYAIGVMLYESLAGRSPHPRTGSLRAMLDAIAENDPPPLRGRAGPVAVDDELEAIVLRALARDPARRYQSASALEADLEAYLAGDPIDAKRDSGVYLLRKALHRYRMPVAVGTLFVAVLVVFSVVLSIAYHRARVEADKVRQINLFLEDTLGSVPASPGGGDVAVRDLIDDAVHWVDIALAEQPEAADAIRTMCGNSYRSMGLLEQAERQLVAAHDGRLARLGGDHPDVAHSKSALGLLRRAQGRHAEAEALFRDALDIRRRALGADSYEASLTLSNLAVVRRDQRAWADARLLFTESMRIRLAIFGPRHADVAMCTWNLAMLEEMAGDDEAAARLYRAALAVRRRVLHPEHPDLARSLVALGTLLGRTGSPAEAETLLAEAVALRASALRPGHWLVAEARSGHGAALAALDRRDEAEVELRLALEGLTAVFDDDDPRVREARERLAALGR